MTKTFRAAVMTVLVLVATCLAAAPAQADHHIMKIREVYTGFNAAGDDQEYVVLQMTTAGQNNMLGQGQTVRLYESSGAEVTTCVFSSNPPNGENQRTILIGTPNAASAFGLSLECTMPNVDYISPVGGAVCFTSTTFQTIDCVSWGTFGVFGTLPAGCTNSTPPSCTGTPETGPIPDGTAIGRTIAPNCATLLEDADDTNVSQTDFSPVTADPRNNASPITETPCSSPPPGGGGGGGGTADTTSPETTITGGPKTKSKKGKATFSFSANEPGSTFECKLDNGAFEGCTTPRDIQVKKGKHTFAVRAIDAAGNVDSSPATQDWTVKKKKKKK